MKKPIILIFFLFLFVFQLQAQDRPTSKKPIIIKGKSGSLDSLSFNKMKRSKRSKVVYQIKDYKYFYLTTDTLVVDTVLNIRNYYKFNGILKDDLDKLPFSNLGLGFTDLSFNEKKVQSLLPGFVAYRKTSYLWFPSQIPFYKLPSAYSDLYYINGIGQGQMLRAFIAANIHPRLSFSLGYRGISSLGLYKNSSISLGRLHTSWVYHTKNKRYHLKFFYLSQDYQNDENGGIKTRAQFENGGDIFKDRSRIDVNFTDAQSLLKGSQIFVNQNYNIFKNTGLAILNETYYHKRVYKYEQNQAAKDFFGDSFIESDIKDSLNLKQFYNLSAVKFHYKKFDIQSGIKYIFQHYYTDSTKVVSGNVIPSQIKYQDLSWRSQLNFTWKKLIFNTNLEIIPTQNLQGYIFQSKMRIYPDSLTNISAQFTSSSQKPDFKYLMFQSAYKHLNWYNPNLKNELKQEISAFIERKKWGKLDFSQKLINNFTYFSSLDTLPHQQLQGVLISIFRYGNDFNYRKFGFSPDILLQKVIKGQDILSLPTYVIRGSLYYSNRYFNRNLFVQAGITAKYFEAFYAPYYHPVLGDFLVQNQEKIGGYPILNVFVNFKVKRFRFYLKAEHINALWEYKKPKYYVAPGYPYRDFLIRFGINWVFFN